jgi:RNA-directed DNA polymerase
MASMAGAAEVGEGRVPTTPGNAGGGKGLHFWLLSEESRTGRLAMGLLTPTKIRTLQRKLYCKAKAEAEFRLYLLYDKVWCEDILSHAWSLAKANGGAPGVDDMTFAGIEAAGLGNWLAGLRAELKGRTYQPQPVRRC